MQRVSSIPLVLVVGVSGLFVGCQSTPEVKPAPPVVDDAPPEAPPAAGVFYEVVAGDTVYDIARRHDVSAEELIEVNGLEASGFIAVGQLVFIPDDGLALSSPSPVAPPQSPTPATTRVDGASLSWPIDGGIIVRDFDPAKALDGMIMIAPQGTPVLAAADGEVAFVGEGDLVYGRMIILKHEGEMLTIYAHLADVRVARGDRVRDGAEIGTVGESGRTESPQLHFQVRQGRLPINPLTALPPP